MILMIRDNECFEPRVKNHLQYFEENNIKYHVIAWNRNGAAVENEHITFFRRRAEYGKRLANIPNKVMWMLFVVKEIYRQRKECVAIHACDIDAILPALVTGKILKKKVIFDIFDWISSPTGKGTVYTVVEWLQNFAYKHSDCIILCEEERRQQAKATNKNILVLPNIPNGRVKFDKETMESTRTQRKNYDYVISYVGVFDRDRGFENLLECVANQPNILLNIAGFGVLDELVRGYADTNDNICYWGRVEYEVGQAIMKNSDLIAAMYHLTCPLHKYAAPNKYYESLMLEVPMITTKNTLVGSKTEKYDTGFVLDETIESLEKLLTSANLREEIKKKKEKCHIVWNDVYKNYYEQFMESQYLTMIANGKD